MDWNLSINRAVCWRIVGDRHRPAEILEPKEKEIISGSFQALFGDAQHVLGYVQGTRDDGLIKQGGGRPNLAPLTPNDLPTPSQSFNGSLEPSTSPAISINDDVLTMIFTYLADTPLESPPIFQNGTSTTGRSFLTIARLGHSSRSSQPQPASQKRGEKSRGTLRACTLVSKSWYHAALKLMWHTAVLRLENLEEELVKWGSSIYGVVEGNDEPEIRIPGDGVEIDVSKGDILMRSASQRRWARRLVLLGGGTKSAPSSPSRIPLQDLWDIFPCVQNVEIFGYGWGTDGLLDVEADPAPAPGIFASPRKLPSFHRIRTLEITATSEYLLRGKVPGQNFLEVARFLTHLSALLSLTLRGFTCRVSTIASIAHTSNTVPQPLLAHQSPNYPSLPRQDQRGSDARSTSPSYALLDLPLDKCSLSLVVLQWVMGRHTSATMRAMAVDGCSFWDEKDADGIWDMNQEVFEEAAFEAMVERLSLDLPIFSMSKNE